MNDGYLEVFGQSNKKHTARTTFEVVTKLVIPTLSLVAFILLSKNEHPTEARLLLGLAVLSVCISLYPSVEQNLSDRWEHKKDRRTVIAELPTFRAFVKRFGAFVNRQTSDTLHYIISSDYLQSRQNPDLKIPDLSIWFGYWEFFAKRRDPRTVEEFREAIMEFHFLVGSYANHCVAAVFERPPANWPYEMNPAVKGKLNLFQQKFARFLDEYHEFTTALSESRPALEGVACSFMIPKPLA